MSEYPRVSIVTPSYNQGAYLEQTISSVLGQDYPNIEYIVVDGASTDNSIDIIRKYSDRIRWWVSEPDHGQAEAINKGFAHTGGTILGWINSDDTYLAGTIQAVVTIFLQNPEIGLVFADVYSVDAKSEIFNTMRYGSYNLVDLMCFRMIGQTSVFFRREVWEKSGGLDQNYHYLLDHQLWLKMAATASMKYIPQVWSSARYHEKAKNKAYPLAFGKEAFRLVDWMQVQPDLAKIYSIRKAKILAGAYRLNGYYLSEGGMYFRSLQSYWHGFWLDPGTVLHDWRRIIFNFFGWIGLENIQEVYKQKRKSKYTK
jgi:glycosyltransferase involved in cell wall biosynthesis